MATLPKSVPQAEKSEPVPQEKQRGGGKKILIALVVLLVLAAGATAAWLHFRDRVSSDDANVDGHISAIAPKISGTVSEVAVLDNQPVKAGQVLVRIDPRDYQAKVDMAKAALQQAQSQLQSAQQLVPLTSDTTQSATAAANAQLADAEAEQQRARVAYEQASSSDIAVAQANLRSKQASNDRAQADLARMKPLVDKAEISQQQ